MEELFEGFKVYKMVGGVVSITFTKNGLGFSKTAVERLGSADFVQVLFNREKQQMAVVACNADDEGSSRFARAGKDGVRWNSKDLSQTIRQITGWQVDKGERYTITGEYMEVQERAAILFDFTKAEVTQG